MKQTLDVLAFGTHPDDLEIACGGTLLLMANRGHRVGAVDLTRGELGTRGSHEIRLREAAAAGQILKVCVRENLGIPDGGIEKTRENLLRVIHVIRQFRPRLLLAPYWEERHYDHVHASQLVAEAAFYSGLAKIETGQESFRPYRVLYYMSRIGYRPSFIVDISEVLEAKMQALRCYRSQFHTGANGDDSEDPENQADTRPDTLPDTMISTPFALEALEAAWRYYGAMIGARYGEPFLMREALELRDPVSFFGEFPDTRHAHLFPHG
ncbi:MAG: bacillithiol biosynthesis deacetylase BshB1 [Acidobacteria bacterium]|nr:bacillithiol biosynthesis deacetylase BshB1 [Acidobacteriota bacterium]